MIKEVIDLPLPGSRYWHVGSGAKIFLGTYSLPPPLLAKQGGSNELVAATARTKSPSASAAFFQGLH